MDELKGSLVESVKGRDKGKRYVVTAIIDRYFLLVADGERKTLAHPKRKNRRHVVPLENAAKLAMDWTDDTQGDDRIRNFLTCHEKEV